MRTIKAATAALGTLYHKNSGQAPRVPSAAGRFRLLRYFGVSGIGAFVVVAGALAWLDREQAATLREVQEEQRRFVYQAQDSFLRQQEESARRDLLAVHDSGNFNLTRLFANALWERDFAPFVARAQTVAAGHCQAMADVRSADGKTAPSAEKKACLGGVGRQIMALPGFTELNTKVFDAMRKTTVFKIKVYDLRGITVYSSDHSQIGEDKSGNPGFKSALQGKTASQLSHRDQFGAFEGVVHDRDLMESYLPVMAPGMETIVGVFEVYSDVTPLLAQIRNSSEHIRAAAVGNQKRLDGIALSSQEKTGAVATLRSIAVFAVLAALFGVLYFVARRAERSLHAQEAEREHAQQKLAQSEKMASLGQMVAGVAHQLNTPLAFSRNNVSLAIQQLEEIAKSLKLAAKLAELVRRTPGDRVVLNVSQARPQLEACSAGPEDAGMIRDMLGDVLHGIEQMSELVVNMRDFTRLDRAKVGEYDLNKGLKTVAYVARSAIPNGIQIVEKYGPVPPILCTPSQLNQVFLNLINNAAQAIKDIGTITLRTRVDAGRVRIDIQDDGSGIPADVLPHIFETYFTTKPEGVGTGLGLSIARDIVRGHGGDIEVATRAGKGTMFTVWLPLQGAKPLAKAA